MNEKADRLEVHATAPHTYRVAIKRGAAHSSHLVTVPSSVLAVLGVDESEEQRVVESSFAFLLAREPPNAILETFSLDVISDYFPAYLTTLCSEFGASTP